MHVSLRHTKLQGFFTWQHLVFKALQRFVGQKLTDAKKNTKKKNTKKKITKKKNTKDASTGNKISTFCPASLIVLVTDPESVEVSKCLSLGYSGIWIRFYSKVEKLNIIFRGYTLKP